MNKRVISRGGIVVEGVSYTAPGLEMHSGVVATIALTEGRMTATVDGAVFDLVAEG